MNRVRKTLIPMIFAGLIVVLQTSHPATAHADENLGFRGWGPRVGITIDPDQLHFGAHADFGNFADHVRFQPNVELGLGDDLTMLNLNLDAAYRFSSRWDTWTPYLGGGVGLYFIGNDNNGLRDGSSTEAGLNVLGGIERGLSSGSRFFLESKLGLIDAPDFSVMMGWTFHH